LERLRLERREKKDSGVIFLAHKTEEAVPDTMAFFACKHCRNKTYTLTEDRVGDFPLVRCAACGNHMGRIGWAPEDRP